MAICQMELLETKMPAMAHPMTPHHMIARVIEEPAQAARALSVTSEALWYVLENLDICGGPPCRSWTDRIWLSIRPSVPIAARQVFPGQIAAATHLARLL